MTPEDRELCGLRDSTQRSGSRWNNSLVERTELDLERDESVELIVTCPCVLEAVSQSAKWIYDQSTAEKEEFGS